MNNEVKQVALEDALKFVDVGQWEQAAGTYEMLIKRFTKEKHHWRAADCCVAAASAYLKMTPPALVRAMDRLQSASLTYVSLGKKENAAKCEERLAAMQRQNGDLHSAIATYAVAYRLYKDAGCVCYASYCKQEGVAIVREMRAKEK